MATRNERARRIEALEESARPSADPSATDQRQHRLQATLAADPDYREVMAVINRFDDPRACLADPEGREAAKGIAYRLAAAHKQLEGESGNG